MARLYNRDLRKLLSALNNLHSDVSRETLPERTLAAVGAILSTEITAFDCFDSAGNHTGEFWFDNLLTSEDMKIFAAHVHEHPSFTATVMEKRTDVLKITDLISPQQFHQTALYNEFYRRVGVHRQMTVGLPVSPEQLFTCALNRSKTDFSERERTLLAMLSPHLLGAINNARAFAQLEQRAAVLQTAFGAVSQGVIVLDAERRIKFISDAAAAFLEKYFADEKRRANGLPESLRRWAARANSPEEFDLPLPPLAIKGSRGELQVRLIFNSSTRETTLLFEEKQNHSPASFEFLGLTRREAEVMRWVMQGKTNIEIGVLCGISWRTAQKHVEHICEKLGVETRSAAIAVVLEKLNRTH